MATDFEIMTKHVESGIEEANCFCELVRDTRAADDGSIPVWQHVRLDNIVNFIKTKRKKLHDVRRAAQKKPGDVVRVGHYMLTAEHVAGEIQTFINEGLEALTSKEVKGNLVDFHQKKKLPSAPGPVSAKVNPHRYG